MAQILVRKIEQEVKNRLQRRAKCHGRSMEEEVREILRDATKTDTPQPRKLGSEMQAIFGKVGLRRGEEIQELRGFQLQVPDFEE